MRSARSEALVLRVVDFGESDRIVHLLLPERGRLSAIAKGARRSARRFPGTLDLFNHLRVQLAPQRPAAALARLEQATLVHAHTALRGDPARFALGCYLLELIDRLAPEGGARPDLRRLFAFALAALREASRQRPDARLRTFLELHLLEVLGLRPELSRCVRCGRELPGAEAVAFHVAEGGPLCGSCDGAREGPLRVQRGTLRALDQGLRFELGRLDRLVLGPRILEEARLLLHRFHRFHLGLELKSEPFLDRVLAAQR